MSKLLPEPELRALSSPLVDFPGEHPSFELAKAVDGSCQLLRGNVDDRLLRCARLVFPRDAPKVGLSLLVCPKNLIICPARWRML